MRALSLQCATISGDAHAPGACSVPMCARQSRFESIILQASRCMRRPTSVHKISSCSRPDEHHPACADSGMSPTNTQSPEGENPSCGTCYFIADSSEQRQEHRLYFPLMRTTVLYKAIQTLNFMCMYACPLSIQKKTMLYVTRPQTHANKKFGPEIYTKDQRPKEGPRGQKNR